MRLKISVLIRLLLSFLLVIGVYHETGLFTALFAFLSLAEFEITGHLLVKLLKLDFDNKNRMPGA